MTLTAYRDVLAVPGVRSLLLFSIVFRVPYLATSVVLTLHVVTTLGRGYGEAGLAATLLTLASALGQPMRGRAVDRLGLRRAILPAVVAATGMYGLAPFVGYWGLLAVVFLGGLLPLPIFTITRQSLSAQVPSSQRRSAFALDSMGVELSFMAGPALGVLAATRFSSTVALLAVGSCVAVSGLALMAFDPPTRAAEHGEPEPANAASIGPAVAAARPVKVGWTPDLATMIAAAAASTVVLAGTDVAIVAFARQDGALALTGLVFVTWGAGSILGAAVYGAMRHPVPVTWLLLLLGALTVPIGLTPNTWLLALAILPAAALCAPVITATANAVAGLVPDRVLGEAMGWHGAALTGGTALGAPLAGVAMDAHGPWAGFAVVGVTGTALAVVGFVVVHLRRRHEVRAIGAT